MRIFLFNMALLILLTSCLPRHYPQLSDVPNYTPPSLSPSQAQKEIDQLKSERASHSSTKND